MVIIMLLCDALALVCDTIELEVNILSFRLQVSK